MADKYIEFQEKVKFILDKSNARKDVQEFAEEVQGAFENVKVGIDAKSLDQLGKMFNEKLDELGKKPIVFNDIEINDKALKEITMRFMNAIGDGIRAGVQSGMKDALAAIAELEKSKAPKVARKSELKNRITGFSALQNFRLSKDETHPHPLKKEGDITAQAQKIYDQFKDARNKLIEAESTIFDDDEYNKLMDNFYEAVDNMYRMRQTIKDNIDEFGDEKLKKKFKIDKLNMMVDNAFAEVGMSLDNYITEKTNQYEAELKNIHIELTKIDGKINEIKNSNPEIISKEMADGALKSLEEVEKAYDRIRNKTKKKEVNKNKLGDLKSALEYDPATENNKNILGTLSKGLTSARQNGASWEEEYRWIVKFVKQYKYLQENGRLSEHLQKQYKPLFNELVGMAENAETSLQTLVDRAEGKIKPEDAGDNSEKLRIEEEKRLAAENQAKTAATLASAAEREGEAKKETLKIEEKRLAIMKELAKYGTLKDAMSAGGKKIDFNGETVHFGSMVSDYMDEALGQSFSREAYEKLWKEARVEFGPKFEPVEITKEDAIAIIREKVPDNILDGWFRDGDSGYKAKLEQLAMSDDDVRNAALNIMWSNFKEFSGKDIGFAEFLQSEISMYRGKNQENYVDGDETIAFTFDKKVAEGFGKYVLETLVKPIETIGAYQTTGESEALVYRDKLEDKPEYQQWHDEMKGIANEADRMADEQEKARKEAEARVDAEKEAADEIERQKRSLDKIGDTYKKNILPGVTKEISAQLDSKTGDFNRLVIGDATEVEDNNNFVTDYDSFTGGYKEHYDTDYHTHPTDVAAPSMKDLARYKQSSDKGYQNRAIIQAMKEALFLDFSSLSMTATKEMIAEYGAKSEQIKGEFLAKYGEDRDPTSENNQKLAVALKNAFLEVVQKYPGVAKYVDQEMPRYDSYYDRYEELPEDAKQLIKEIAVLYSELDDDKKDWNAIDEKEAKLASLDAGMGRAVGTEQWIDLTDRISAEMSARQENIDSIQKETTSRNELSKSTESKIPSEDDIKGGNASWRGMPIKYNALLDHEAENKTDYMEVGDKFFEAKNQDNILDHEVAHNIADRLMKYAANTWGKATDIFMSNGEGLYGDLGASAMSETLAHAVTEYFSDPDALKARSEGAFNYIEEYLKKSGDTLDNVYSKRGESPIESQSDNVVSDNEKKIKSYEELKGVLQEYYDAIVNIKNAEGDQKQPHVEKYMDLNNLLLEQLDDDDQRSQLMSKLKDVSSAGVDEESVKSIAQMFGIEVPQAAETAKQAVDGLNTSLEKQQQIEQADSSQEQVTETKAETTAIEQQNEELKENLTLKQMVENAESGTHGQSLADIGGPTGSADTTVGANMQELQNVLSNITYSVKIINDDTDKTANKIALDDSTLEATLNRVFANILNPVTEQNDGNLKEPWALESTLQTVKGVLDIIQTNTAKIGTSEVATVADDGVLKAIKTAVESINKKIVQGTKVLRTSSNKKTEEKSADLEIKNPKELGNVKATKVDPRVRDLRALYAEQGTLEAQQELDNQESVKKRLEQIEADILGLKKEGVALDEQEIKNIKDKAKHNEANRLIVEKTKEAEKKAAQDEKAQLKAEMKDIRDKSRIAKADSTWRSGTDIHGLSMNMVDEKQGINVDKIIDHPAMQSLRAELDKLKQQRKEVNELVQKGNDISDVEKKQRDAATAALQEQTAATQKQIGVVKELQQNYEFFSGDNSVSLNQVYTGGDLEQQLKQAITLATNGKAKFVEYDTTLKRWTYTVNGANNEVKHYTAGMRDLDGQLRAVHTSTKKTESMFEAIKRKTKEVFTYFSGSSVVYKLFGALRQGIQYIREIDSALTELKKVTDETEETYDKFLDTAAKTGARLGTPISAVIEATATFAKLGYTMREASEMAEAAIVYKNVGDGIASTEDAADSIISTLKGFGMEASETMRIVDRFNEVGNRFAITSKGIGEALRLSASALNEGGNSLDESIALITAANEVVRFMPHSHSNMVI